MSQIAYTDLPVVPLRSEANDCSEMVSQVLFGEQFFVNEINGHWANITLLNDHYQGWVDVKSVKPIEADVDELQQPKNSFTTSDLISKVTCGKTSFYVPMGSSLPFYKGDTFKLGKTLYKTDSALSLNKFDATAFETLSKQWLNVPYLWGGKTCFGVDCSGLTQVILGQFGINLKRDASMQVEQGTLVAFLAEAQLGDLAFFENEEGNIIHVGIILSPNSILHAHGKVRIDQLDDAGILNTTTGKHTHRLRLIKRFFAD